MLELVNYFSANNRLLSKSQADNFLKNLVKIMPRIQNKNIKYLLQQNQKSFLSTNFDFIKVYYLLMYKNTLHSFSKIATKP